MFFFLFFFSLNVTRASGQSCLLLKSFANKLISLGLHIDWIKDISSLYNSVTLSVQLGSQHSTTGWPDLGSAGRSKNSSQNIVTEVRNTILATYGSNRQRWEAAVCAHTRSQAQAHTHCLCPTSAEHSPGWGWLSSTSPEGADSQIYFSCGYVSLVLCVLIHIRIQLDYLSLAWLVTFQIPYY